MTQARKISKVGNTRALAIFLVVLGHSIIIYSGEWTLYESIHRVGFLNDLKRVIDFLQMQLFFFLSGYLFFFTHRKRKGLLKLAADKSKRLLVPYIAVASCYLLPIRLLVGFESYKNMTALAFIKKLLVTEDVGHLWFLPALFVTFMLSEVLIQIFERLPIIKKYPEICLCIIALILYMEGWRIGFGYAPLLNTFNFMLYFTSGYLVCSKRELIERIYALRLLRLALPAINLSLIILLVLGFESVTITLCAKTLSLLNIFQFMPRREFVPLEKVDKNSFGIYLFHSPLVYITYSCIPNASPFIVVFLNLIVFGAAAYALTELVRKTRLKFIIGE